MWLGDGERTLMNNKQADGNEQKRNKTKEEEKVKSNSVSTRVFIVRAFWILKISVYLVNKSNSGFIS